jgi:hypothetical protein
MNMTLPDWVPWWVPLVLLLPALLFGLAFLFMPFSVIGLKSRLESIEARLDEIQADLRQLSLRDGRARPSAQGYDDTYVPTPPRRAEPAAEPPPMPRALYDSDTPEDRPPPPPHMRPVRRLDAGRQEPRVNWPRT